MPDLTRTSVVVASEDQISSRLGAEAVILSLKSDIYFGLNEVGAFVWKKLQEPRKVSDLIAAITEAYEVSADKCEQDLFRLLEELARHRLIDIRDDA